MNNINILPQPSLEAQKHSNELLNQIIHEIALQGPITFARFMELALYAPRFGYYRNGIPKFGIAGDFVTAPELSPLFSQCIARQCQQILNSLPSQGDILELGPGSGRMAKTIIEELAKQNCLPNQYYLLELSSELKQRQRDFLQQELPEYYHLFKWCEQLPEKPLTGIILANEVIDAMPVHKFCWEKQTLYECYVGICETHPFTQQNKQVPIDHRKTIYDGLKSLCWHKGPPSSPQLIERVNELNISCKNHYYSEINLMLPAWIASLADSLERGLILLIDYGFPEQEYYHPDRHSGTIMCHYQHQAHDDPLILPGIQDITAHVDFTAIAKAALKNHLTLAGFTHQAGFLLNCGLLNLSQPSQNKMIPVTDQIAQYNIAQQIKMLTLPSEMGELFKAIAFMKNMHKNLLGFTYFNQLTRIL